MLNKKCLSCGNITDNKMYACSGCLNKIDTVRQPLRLSWIQKKDFILGAKRISLFVNIAVVLLAIITLTHFFYRLQLPFLFYTTIILPVLAGFLMYFLAASAFMRYGSKLFLIQLGDTAYYRSTTFRERIKDKRPLKLILYFLLIFMLLWIIYVGLMLFFEASAPFRLSQPILELKYFIIRGFTIMGMTLGCSLGLYQYSDWVAVLEK